MKIKLNNARMMEMLHQLEPLLPRRDKIGYVAARNYRSLTDQLTEYEMFRRELIQKYGETDKGDDGSDLGTISIQIGSPNFKAFCDELAPFSNMVHDVELMTVDYEDVIGCLSGEEILKIDWMLEDHKGEI